MLKTNSKKARENIREYITDHFYPEGYDIPEIPANDFPAIASAILSVFRDEFKHQIRLYPSEASAFEEWCAGLPTILDTCYYYNRSAVADLGDILEETEAERERFSERDAERLLTSLIYRELVKFAK